MEAHHCLEFRSPFGAALRPLEELPDMEVPQRHLVLLAETFMDPSRFAGTCCRAVGWMEIESVNYN